MIIVDDGYQICVTYSNIFRNDKEDGGDDDEDGPTSTAEYYSGSDRGVDGCENGGDKEGCVQHG